MKEIDIYGIGNILIDIISSVNDDDLRNLQLDKGIMKLVDTEERSRILNYIDGREITYNCGGSAPNTIINLAAMGLKVALSGRIGNDDFGKKYQKQLHELSVDSYLTSCEGEHTGSSIILVTPDSERTMNTDLGTNGCYSVDNLNPEILKKARYLYFTGYMWDTESQKKALLKAIEIARDNQTLIAFDVADPFAVNRYKDDFLKLIPEYFDIVFANTEESLLLFGTDTPEKSLSHLSDLCRIAIVKNGRHGSFVAEGDNAYFIPPYSVHACDTTGAGDMYAAGFLTGIIRGFNIDKAAVLGSWLASWIVRYLGAQFSDETRKDISELLKSGEWDYTDTERIKMP